jgi:hypothetical protein
MQPGSRELKVKKRQKNNPQPTRREFLQTAAGAALALAGSALPVRANNHPHPSPQSLTYLDRRMYLHNMELIAHILPGQNRGAKMQMMSAGSRRYLVQDGCFIDVSNLRKPFIYHHGGWKNYQAQVAWNQKLRKWILITSAAAPITGSTPTAPHGKYDDPKLLDNWRNYKGLRGIRVYDISEPTRMALLAEFSTGATGSGTHRNYYDGGRYAYLDTAPDDSFIHQLSYFRPLANGNMIVDMSDPSSPKEVSMWWVPGSRKGEEAEYEKWQWTKLKYPEKDQTPFVGLHGPVYVPKRVEEGGNRGYGAWGCFGLIILDLSDVKHQKEIGRFEPPPQYAAGGIAFHTIWCGGLEKGFVFANGETTNPDCNQIYLPIWVIDIRDEQRPTPVAQFPRPAPPPEAPYRDFCFKRGRFGAHNPPHLKAPGAISPNFIAYSYFNAGIRCYDVSDLLRPTEVGYFVPPQAGDLHKWASWNRGTENVFVEWDRNIIYAATDTGIYALSCPQLGKPVLDPMPVSQWSLAGLNEGAP